MYIYIWAWVHGPTKQEIPLALNSIYRGRAARLKTIIVRLEIVHFAAAPGPWYKAGGL